MTPGLNRSLAARAAASNPGRSSSEQPIKLSADSRDIDSPGRTSAKAFAHSSREAVLTAATVTAESNDTTPEHGNVGGCMWPRTHSSGAQRLLGRLGVPGALVFLRYV